MRKLALTLALASCAPPSRGERDPRYTLPDYLAASGWLPREAVTMPQPDALDRARERRLLEFRAQNLEMAITNWCEDDQDRAWFTHELERTRAELARLTGETP